MKGYHILLMITGIFLLVGCGKLEKEQIGVTKEIIPPEQVVFKEAVPNFTETTEDVILLDNGCFSNEIFIEQEEICAIPVDCSDINSCVNWGDELVIELEGKYGSLVLEKSVVSGEEGITVLTTYDVDQDENILYTDSDISLDEMERQADLWYSFSWLIPEKYREEITRFVIFKSGDTLSYVSIHDAGRNQWTLGMNNQNIELASETLVTYLHEYAHLLSLNNRQVDYWRDEQGCDTLYFEDTGCFYSDAYITHFYEQFWKQPNHGEFNHFFVSEYASSSPEEDFAESFAHFVLTQTPLGDNIKEEKVLFFYKSEELVTLRAEILSRVATWLARM